MNVSEALTEAITQFSEAKIDDPHLEAEILLAAALSGSRTDLLLHPEKFMPQDILNLYRAYVKRRLKREPSAYIIGHQAFLALDFFVDNSVLIPRPETELLAELALGQFRENRGPLKVADLCTGSGCLAVALAKYLPEALVSGFDISPAALGTAQKNAVRHNVTGRCTFLCGNLLAPLAGKYDAIISNPPYIPTGEIDKLQPEITAYEPRLALDGGPDGLAYLRKIISGSPAYLKPDGFLLLEFGDNQEEIVGKIAANSFRQQQIINDYSGRERFFLAREPIIRES